MPDFGSSLFDRLQPAVADAFERSDVSALQRRLGKAWYYDLTMLPFSRGKRLVLALNPGVDENAQHVPQIAYPGTQQFGVVAGWRFVQRAAPRLQRFYSPLRDCNYFNLCPFRSKRAGQLTAMDWDLGVQAFFKDAMEAVQPPDVLMIGTSGLTEAARHGLVIGERRIHQARNPRGSGQMEVGVFVGHLAIAGERYPFRSVPYPLFAMDDVDHEAAWKLAFQ